MFCVYKTTYHGDKLPKYYVGSSSLKKVNGGYKGSVHSMQWKTIWERELKDNPHLFKVEIISEHKTRKEALNAELNYQKLHNVVSSNEWINKSFAQPNGFFGMDVSGTNNPMFGKCRKGEKHKGGENISKALRHLFDETEKGLEMKKFRSEQFKMNNPSTNPEVIKKAKETWKQNNRGIGEKNGMYGKVSPMNSKKLYNNGIVTKAFVENEQPEGWVLGRHIKNQWLTTEVYLL